MVNRDSYRRRYRSGRKIIGNVLEDSVGKAYRALQEEMAVKKQKDETLQLAYPIKIPEKESGTKSEEI